MKYLEYPLEEGGFINRFLTAGVFTEVQQFKKATLNGRVNEWLKKGFAIHENPCRQEFVQRRKENRPDFLDLDGVSCGEMVHVFGQSQPLTLYFPMGNPGVEFSGFYYRPTYLRLYGYVELEAEEAGESAFELETCGGVTIWLNEKLILDYTPFTRNMVKKTALTLPLLKGHNKLLICLDDLAERDTDYYFRLRSVKDASLIMKVPVKDEVEQGILNQLEEMLQEISFEKEAYISEEVRLGILNPLLEPVKLKAIIAPGEFIEKMEGQETMVKTREYDLLPGEKSLHLLDSDELPPGYYYFTMETEYQNISMRRKIGNQLVREDFLKFHEESLEERRRHILEVILDYAPDNTYKAAALLKLFRDHGRAEAIVLEELPGVRARKDCSDFHFIIMLYIYRTFGERLTKHLKDELEEAMLDYRYWMDEPGDDVMWFFSENHALLFHICQYLAGSWLPDRCFTNSQREGRLVRDRGEELLRQWFQDFFAEFITEWNSNAYIPVDILGLGTLYNLTEPGSEFHENAKKALDMIFYSLCINAHKGAVMTSFGRSYEKEMKGNYNAGTTSLLYLAYGDGYLNRACNGCIPLALGDYEPPMEYKQYLRPKEGQSLLFMNTQGYLKHVNLYLWKDSHSLLSTAIGFKPFQKGYQEHIVQAVIDEVAQAFVNHPGEAFPYGSGRPNFWAGNGVLPLAVQYKNTAILRYHLEEGERIDYTHAYAPLSAFSRYLGEEGIVVLEKAGAYIALKALNGLTMEEKGPARFREFISWGRDNVWVVRTGRIEEYGDLSDVLEAFKTIEIQLEDRKVTVRDDYGIVYEVAEDYLLKVNGKEVYSYPLDVAGKLYVEEEDLGR